MKTFRALVRVQLLQLLQSFGKKKRRSILLTVFLILLSMIYCSFVTGMTMFQNLEPSNYGIGLLSLLIMNSMILTVMGISWSSGLLFGFRDYDLLMSLPLRQEQITASKLLSFFMTEYLYSFPFVFSAAAIYAWFARPPFLSYVWMVLGFFALPVLPAVVAILGGSLLHVLTAGKKREALWRSILNMTMVLAFAGFSMWRSGTLAEGGDVSAPFHAARYLFPISDLYGKAIVSGNGIYIVVEIVAAFGLLAIVLRYLSGLLLRIASKGNQGYHVRNFRLKPIKGNSVLAALTKRERRLFFTDINGLFNLGFGALILLGVEGYTILFPQRSLFFSMLMTQDPLSAGRFATLMVGMLAMSVNTACVSISLEGRRLWILRSLPVSEKMIFAGKVLFPLETMIVPCAVLTGVMLWRIGVPLPMALLGIVYVLAGGVASNLFGLVVNLLFPKLDWDRSIIVYKRSLSAFLGVLGSYLCGGILLAIGMSSSVPTSAFLLAAVGVLCLLSLVFFWILNAWGPRRFRELS